MTREERLTIGVMELGACAGSGKSRLETRQQIESGGGHRRRKPYAMTDKETHE